MNKTGLSAKHSKTIMQTQQYIEYREKNPDS